MDTYKHVIPYVPVLDALDLNSQEIVMESRALRLPIMCNNWREEYPYTPITVADLAYSNKGIYCRFWSKGVGLKASYTEDGGKVHEDSCVEIFLQIPGSDRYFNFEFNCIGVCDAARRRSRTESVQLKPVEYASIKRATSERPGLIFDRPQGVHTFWVSVFIPFELLGLDIDDNTFPSHILGNLYKCGDKTSVPHFLSWQPIEAPQPDFHRPEQFTPLYFAIRQ
ncbi:MAG: carbohydrate-binding family 9-like protein [Bacteroidales bacterium]|uniref:carbohydrate-binding family 9-like protein n=1 Tax=Porphyromonas sp. TaxID=1924944 RepID=UPI002972B473|nr:carbohydrate-binding family 9-like protein [Porphyromonas sp.]MDD7438466.1 carbohydrate-binding family 9-like protein [Bacteroidales bacterium]MDY3067458.1 carbohydrate-binding family 9-like protein [Porphyromonas sp.]